MEPGSDNSLSVLYDKYPPSSPCTCKRCVSFCQRPGWWLVEGAEKAIAAGLSDRMILEISPAHNFAVLSPAFKRNEVNYALQEFSTQGSTFLKNNLCELFGTGLQPLECRFCHHERVGMGKKCHLDIEKVWNTNEAKRLIVRWEKITGLWERQGFLMFEK